MPVCSDLMISFCVSQSDSQGTVGAVLSKYGRQYRARIEYADKRMVIEKIGPDVVQELASSAYEPDSDNTQFKFANVDHELILEFGNSRLSYDLGTGPEDVGARDTLMPGVWVLASGRVSLTHVGIYRDIHYISNDIRGVIAVYQGGRDEAFELGADEFFVLGDNSPASADSRCWNSPGKANNNQQYRQGTVPRDYLVGKAFFVYWPGPFRPFNDTKLADHLERRPLGRILKMALNVPCVGGMKIIKGGK